MTDHQLGSYKYISIEFYSKLYFLVKETDLEMSEKMGAIVIKHQYINNHFLTHLQHSPKCHIYVSVNWFTIVSDNGLLYIRHQAII